MGEGEVCFAMASGGLLSEMECEKTKQKRDRVTDGSYVEPVAKKQAKQGEVARSELEVVTVCVEGEARGKKLNAKEELDKSQLEGQICEIVGNLDREDACSSAVKLGFNDLLDSSGERQGLSEMEPEDHERMQTTADRGDIKLEPSVLQTVKEYPSDMEAGSCGKMELDPSGEKHSSVVVNDMEIEPVVEQPVKDCLIGVKLEPSIGQPVKECASEMETEACVKTQQTGALNASKPEVSVQQPGKECLSEKHLSEGLNDMEIEPIVDQPVKDCLNEMEGDRDDIELEPCIEQPVKECRGEMETEALSMSKTEPVKECVSDMGAGSCGKMESTEVFNESEPVSSVQRPVSEAQSEACVKMESVEALDETEPKPSVLQPVTECTHEMEFDNLIDTNVEFSADLSIKECKHETLVEPCIKKETSNEDICSEVSNPIVSPRDNSSFQTVNSQPDEKLVIQNKAICGEITSGRSGNSSSEGCSSQEEKGTELTSHVVIEAPKDAITSSGVRKITFKFSKRKEDFDSQPSASVVNVACKGFVNGVQKIPRLTRISEQGFHERRDSRVCPPGMEEMPVPGNSFTSVQKLLSTGILDGAKVKYISTSAELIGIVKDGGYLCGCDACNFSNVVRAHEFEEHAGGRKTSHPNKHIYMENGKSIYRIIQVIKKSAPLSRVDEVIRDVAGSAVNEELLQVWKASLQSNTDMAKTDNSHLTKLMELYHPQTRPKSYASSVAVETKPSAEGGHKKRKSRLYYDRDHDLHRLLFKPNGIPDGTALGYYARGDKVLDGYKQGIGIVCSHCDDEISPSQFEAHAGWAVKRQPYRNVYVIPIGMSLHDIALSLANGQSITTSNSDDMCAVCGDGGKLIICDGCPRAFHSDCLELEGLLSEDGQCQYCRDGIGSGRKAAAESRPIVIRLSRVVKAREYEAGGCVICRVPDFSVAEFDDRTVMLCDQCEKEYHVGCLRESGRCDLKALPLDKWFCCDHCDMIHGAVQGVVSNGAAVVSGSVLRIINKKQIEKGLMNGVPNEIRWRMLGGTSRYPEHLPLLSRAAAIFRECFDPIVAKSGRDLIPVMVYGRNISGQDFGGIYCVVLMVGSVVVSAGLLRIFGREVAELPLVATTRQHQGKGYFQALFFCIEELLMSLGVELLVLPAAEEAESIWTKKLGFRKMSDERYTQYSRDIQLTIFKGTSMLEKELRRTT